MTTEGSGPTRIDYEGRRAEVWSWLPESEIEPDALTQIRNVGSLPCAVGVAVMPDSHKGYGMPIGTALATQDAVVPYAVGVDIGCGMIAVRTSLPIPDRDQVRAILQRIYETVPVGQPTKQDRSAGSHTDRQDSEVIRRWADDRGDGFQGEAARIRERADRQLGTLGGGNHFIELQTGDVGLWFMLHTGSRAFGKFICDWYHKKALAFCEAYHTPLPDKELAFLSTHTREGTDYLIDMGFALRYAEESRARIEVAVLAAIREVMGEFTSEYRLETHHNFAAEERHYGKDVVVHRKGAVSTANGVDVTIPGSMQTGSYIGVGKPDKRAMNTCAHGAGRRMGRNAMRREHQGVDIKAEMEAEGIVLVCPPGSDALDEAGRAYKDIESVMRYQADLVAPLTHLRPLGVVKG